MNLSINDEKLKRMQVEKVKEKCKEKIEENDYEQYGEMFLESAFFNRITSKILQGAYLQQNDLIFTEKNREILEDIVKEIMLKRFSRFIRVRNFVIYTENYYMNSEAYKKLSSFAKETISYFSNFQENSLDKAFYRFYTVYLYFIQNTTLDDRAALEAVRVIDDYYLKEGRTMLCKFLLNNKEFYERVYNVLFAPNKAKYKIFEKGDLLKVATTV